MITTNNKNTVLYRTYTFGISMRSLVCDFISETEGARQITNEEFNKIIERLGDRYPQPMVRFFQQRMLEEMYEDGKFLVPTRNWRSVFGQVARGTEVPVKNLRLRNSIQRRGAKPQSLIS